MPGRVLRTCLVALTLATTGCAAMGVGPQDAGTSTRPARTPSGTRTGSTSSTPATTPSPYIVQTLSAARRDRLTACGRAAVARMTLEQQVGQLLVVGVKATDPRQGLGVVRRYRLGGVFLRGRTTLTPARLRDRLDVLQAAATDGGGPPLHVAVDQEGGKVRNLRGAGFSQLPAAVDQARWDEDVLAASTGRLAGQLHDAGVSVNLGPVADTVPPDVGADNPPIGALGRQYGSTPQAVSDPVRIVVDTTQRASVLATLKHFPGLGRVSENTDYSTKAVDRLTSVTDPFLDPFRAGVDAGTALVMVSSARYPRIDSDEPATFSHRIVTDLLRDGLHFDGVVISDDIGNAVALRATPPGERAVRFIEAGGDLVLTIRLSDAGPMTAALLAKARSDAGFRATVRASAERVLTSKARAGLVPCQD